MANGALARCSTHLWFVRARQVCFHSKADGKCCSHDLRRFHSWASLVGNSLGSDTSTSSQESGGNQPTWSSRLSHVL